MSRIVLLPARAFRRRANFGSRAHQHGVVLFVGLIMLLLLSLIGITAMQVSLLQERMAGNFLVQHTGFEAGETALAQGRDSVRTLANAGSGLTLNIFSMQGIPLEFPWTTWLTSDTFPPVAPNASPMTTRRWSPAQGASLPGNGNVLQYYSVAAFGADPSTDAKTALQGVYVF